MKDLFYPENVNVTLISWFTGLLLMMWGAWDSTKPQSFNPLADLTWGLIYLSWGISIPFLARLSPTWRRE